MQELKTSAEWQQIEIDIIVLDPDGWNRANYDYSWNVELITLDEYKSRRLMSTCIYKNKAIECK
jgi:hypothetical protein